MVSTRKMNFLDPESKIEIQVICLSKRVNNYWILELDPRTQF